MKYYIAFSFFFLSILAFGQVANFVPNELACDTDGFARFNLDDLREDILGPSQSASDYTVTFHALEEDRDTGSNPLFSPYTNPIEFQTETIYVRVEDNSNPSSFGFNEFDVIILNSP